MTNFLEDFPFPFSFQIHLHEVVHRVLCSKTLLHVQLQGFLLFTGPLSLFHMVSCVRALCILLDFFSENSTSHLTDPFYCGFVWLIVGSLFLMLFM